MEGPTGGDDVKMSKTLQLELKLFYFDLKENPRGWYLKISEKNVARRSTIIVPVDGIVWFLDMFNYYINTDEGDAFSKELKLDTKVFYFDVSENKWGRFLKVSESSSVNRYRSTIIVPAGSGAEGWFAFRNVLLEIDEQVSRIFIPNQQHFEPSEHLTDLSDVVGAGFISGSGHIGQQIPGSGLNVDSFLVEAPLQDEGGSMALSKVIRADQKRFFFDLGSNHRGHFLRISEVAGLDRSSIVLPLSGLKQFHETIAHFLEITKGRLVDMTETRVRTVQSYQR